MKIITLIVFTSVIVFAVTNESIAHRGIKRGRGGPFGWRLENQFCMVYRPDTVETLSGEVISVEKVSPRNGMFYGVYLNIKTGEKTVPVHLGPGWYIENQEINIEIKDKVEVTGSKVNFNGKEAIAALEIKRGKKVLKLRNKDGVPYWSSRGKESEVIPFEQRALCWIETCGCNSCTQYCSIFSPDKIKTIFAEVVNVEKVSRRNEVSNSVHMTVTSNEETLSVYLGPEWYMEGQGITFISGDMIEIKGYRLSDVGEQSFIATKVKKGNKTLKLRNENGLPLWRDRRTH